MKDLILKAVTLKDDILKLEAQLEKKKSELSDIGDSVESEFRDRDNPLVVKVGGTYYTVFRSVYGQISYEPAEVLE